LRREQIKEADDEATQVATKGHCGSEEKGDAEMRLASKAKVAIPTGVEPVT